MIYITGDTHGRDILMKQLYTIKYWDDYDAANENVVLLAGKNRAFRRWQRNRIIQKKLGILKRVGRNYSRLFGSSLIDAWTHGKPGKLAKGKIHCSCFMCSPHFAD